MTTILSTSHGDRYGYYQIGNAKSYSKIDLIDMHHRMPQAWHWNYNNEFFGSYNWSQEPAANIDELYRRRALQLREKYDYLVLYYSGGYDSTNVLYSFLDNNIPIDEICVYYSSHDCVSNQYLELNSVTWQKIQRLQDQYPNLKVRKIDYSEQIINWTQSIDQLGYGGNLLDMFGNMLSINRLIVDQFYDTVDDWKALLEQGKKLAWVTGGDKPMLRYIDGQWIFNFHDAILHSPITPLRQIIDQGNIGTYELFYWAPEPECADIIIKQCHLIKNHYKQQAQADFSKIPNNKGFQPGWGWEIDNMAQHFVKLIYPRNFVNPEIFFTRKNSKFIFGNRDQWFFESNHDNAILHRQMYQATASDLYSHYRPWFNDGKTIDSGFKNCISPNYIIGETL